MTGKSYNGHPSWTAWNVSLWIANDEGLYLTALSFIRTNPTRARAAEQMVLSLKEANITATPDGARYSKTTILHAMRGLE